MYRSEMEALRLRLAATEEELDRTRAALHRATGREERIERLNNDPVLLIARAVLWGVPAVYAGSAVIYYGFFIALLELGRDGIAFVAFLLLVLAPVAVMSGLAAAGLTKAKRGAWVMGVMVFAFLTILFPPLGALGLFALIRRPCRTAFFPASEPRVRAASPSAIEDPPRLRVELEAAVPPEAHVDGSEQASKRVPPPRESRS